LITVNPFFLPSLGLQDNEPLTIRHATYPKLGRDVNWQSVVLM
jgi:hypothetical protein